MFGRSVTKPELLNNFPVWSFSALVLTPELNTQPAEYPQIQQPTRTEHVLPVEHTRAFTKIAKLNTNAKQKLAIQLF